MHRTPRAGRRAAGAVTAAGVIAAATLAAGCSASSDADNEPAAVDVAAAARGAVRDGGTLRWAVDDVPGTLNAFQDGADAQTLQIASATLPTLFTVDGHGRPQRDGDYLRSVSVGKDRSGRQVVVYHLNPKAVWSDGRNVSADDFVSQWRALSGDDTDFYSAHNAGYDRIATVRRGAKAHEVKVTFARPLAAWQSLFTPLYPRKVTGSPEVFNDGTHDTLAASAGPFSVGGVDADGGTATLVRDTRWWGARAKLDRLVLTAVPRDRRAAALGAGAVDVAEVNASALPGLRGIRGVVVRRAPAAAYTQLTLNGGGTGPLADERVRRAVARAVDRQALADYVLRPAGLPARTLGNHLVLGSQFGYHDDSSAIGGTDARSAQRLLADAGWRQRGTGSTPTPAKAAAPQPGRASAAATRPATATGSPRATPAADAAGPNAVVEPATARTDRSGNALTLRFVLPSGSPTLDAVGTRIAHMLASVGVRTEMERVSEESFFHDHVATGDFDLALYSWPGSAFPASDARPVYAKPMPAADGSLNVQQNYSRVGTDQIDQLLGRAAEELDGGRQRDLARQADARIWAEAGSLPLYQPPQLVAERTSVANAGAFGFLSPRYQDIGFRH